MPMFNNKNKTTIRLENRMAVDMVGTYAFLIKAEYFLCGEQSRKAGRDNENATKMSQHSFGDRVVHDQSVGTKQTY